MKTLTFLLVALLAVFTGSNQSTSSSYQNDSVSIASNVGVENNGSQCHANHINPDDSQAYLPDPSCTPGVKNVAVTQSTIDTTICVSGYTTKIRPPVSYTDQLKLQQIQQYGYLDTNPRDYEEDHFIPLEIGGNPTDPKNLWPEPHPSTNEKDKVEDYLHKEVCNGIISLAQAQSEITQNWYTVFQQIN